MKQFVIILILLFAVSSSVRSADSLQSNNRGVEIDRSGSNNPGKTRIISIGVNAYKYIKQLSFADNDAISIFDYFNKYVDLQDPFSGVTGLLTDDDATNSWKILGGLATLNSKQADWQKEDRLIFYFAGHGYIQADKNDNPSSNEGFLMLSNGKAEDDLLATDAIQFSLLLKVLGDIGKKCKVYLIVDACHSGVFGKCSYSQNNDNVTIISAAQGDELSQEFPDLGGGHGIFTYYLQKGIEGAADNIENDGIITIEEIERYVTDELRNDLKKRKAPKQTPITFKNNKNDPFILLDNSPQNTSTKKKSGMNYPFKLNSNSNYDTSIFIPIGIFRHRIEEGKFIFPEGESAFDIVKDLNNKYSDDINVLQITSELQAILASTGDAVISNYLKGIQYTNYDTIGYISMHLEKALMLTDESNVLYKHLKANYLFLKAVSCENTKVDSSIIFLEEALNYLPSSSFICNELGHLYIANKDYDAAESKLSRAVYYTPNWKLPNYNLAFLLASTQNYNRALIYIIKAIKQDSSFSKAYQLRGVINYYNGNYNEALNDFEKALSLGLNPEDTDKARKQIIETKKKIEKKN